jgi:hypothetical protein
MKFRAVDLTGAHRHVQTVRSPAAPECPVPAPRQLRHNRPLYQENSGCHPVFPNTRVPARAGADAGWRNVEVKDPRFLSANPCLLFKEIPRDRTRQPSPDRPSD